MGRGYGQPESTRAVNAATSAWGRWGRRGAGAPVEGPRRVLYGAGVRPALRWGRNKPIQPHTRGPTAMGARAALLSAAQRRTRARTMHACARFESPPTPGSQPRALRDLACESPSERGGRSMLWKRREKPRVPPRDTRIHSRREWASREQDVIRRQGLLYVLSSVQEARLEAEGTMAGG